MVHWVAQNTGCVRTYALITHCNVTSVLVLQFSVSKRRFHIPHSALFCLLYVSLYWSFFCGVFFFLSNPLGLHLPGSRISRDMTGGTQRNTYNTLHLSGYDVTNRITSYFLFTHYKTYWCGLGAVGLSHCFIVSLSRVLVFFSTIEWLSVLCSCWLQLL